MSNDLVEHIHMREKCCELIWTRHVKGMQSRKIQEHRQWAIDNAMLTGNRTCLAQTMSTGIRCVAVKALLSCRSTLHATVHYQVCDQNCYSRHVTLWRNRQAIIESTRIIWQQRHAKVCRMKQDHRRLAALTLSDAHCVLSPTNGSITVSTWNLTFHARLVWMACQIWKVRARHWLVDLMEAKKVSARVYNVKRKMKTSEWYKMVEFLYRL
jgi:hypothetical protein